MFSKISRKIKLNIIIFLIFFVIIESCVVTYSINHITYRNFRTYAAESVDLSIKNCTFYIDLAMNAADNIASDEHLIDKVKDNTYSLNSLKLSAASIMGVTLYDTAGHEYHSYEISSVLPLSRMLENEAINDFITRSDERTFFSVRTTELARIYNSTIYDPTYGIITYITKINDESGNVAGYLFVDISPKYIYNHYFNYEAYGEFKGAESFIVYDDTDADDFHISYLKKNNDNNIRATYLKEADFRNTIISQDQKYLILAKDIENLNFRLITLIPLHNYYTKIISLFLPIIIMAIILIGVAIYVGYRLAHSIVSAISGLNRKMMQAEQYLKNERR